MAIAAEILLIKDEYWKKYTPINGSVDSALMRPYVILAQDKYLEEFTGTDLLTKIKTDAAAGTITGVYATLLDTYIRKIVMWWAVVEALPSLHVKIDNGSIAIRTSEDTTPITMEELRLIRDSARDNAQNYTKRMVDYLCVNSASFPEYSTNQPPDKNPQTDVYGKTGGIAMSGGNSFYNTPTTRNPSGWPYLWR
jgi:hypothetical protein